MKKFGLFSLLFCIALSCSSTFAQTQLTKEEVDRTAQNLLAHLSLREKIGQTLMLDFRYWCADKPSNQKDCTQDFVRMNPVVQNIMSQNHIGGLILFSNNIKDIAQVTTLTHDFQQTMLTNHKLPILIGTDQEGGIVGRLPRDVSVSFPGNMAITAAYLGHPQQNYSAEIGKTIAKNLKAVGINIDFAPDVDVNVNPLNPVIHVRSFSDDPELVAQQGLQFSLAMQAEGVGATLKHFPGHGDATTDSHIGLPTVSHTLQEAWKIDLYPFAKIIASHSPDLIMTAHIQFPALDDSEIYADRAQKNIITPATLSRKIQHDLLRQQLGYDGVIITDALNMGAIAQNFDPINATIKVLQAGDDIALMPIALSRPEDADKVTNLISQIEAAVLAKTISAYELDQSVLRILKLKIKLGLLQPDTLPLPQKIAQAEQQFADKKQWELERRVTDEAITLVQNNSQVIPLRLHPHTRIHILTPWLEQGAGIAKEISELQKENLLPQDLEVSFVKMADTTLEFEKNAINNADILIVGHSTTKSLAVNNFAHSNLSTTSVFSYAEPQGSLVFPEIPQGDNQNNLRHSFLTANNSLDEAQFAYQTLQYAKNQGKTTIFISLLAPYDLPNYKDVSAAMLAGYNFYGYLNDGGYFRGPSMPAITRIIFGVSLATGKLPINIPDPSYPQRKVYSRGFGLTT